ncbi:MAG: MFS transporter, partial [Cyanobacteria bacterium J06635_10]
MNLRKRTIAAYASPAISIAALSLPLGVYLPPFYTNEMGLGLSVVGSIFMITRFWDIFTDPILGILSDKIETRLGRRRHWIILSAPILMLCVYKIFMPQGTVTGMYLLFWMILLYVGWTLLTISHMSWGAELSSDYNERSRIQGWREFANIFGSLAVLILPTIIEQTSDGDSAMKVAAMGWFTIVLLPISVAAAVWMVPEHPLPKQVQIGWRRATSIVLKNKLLIRLLAADLLNGMALGIISSMYIFFASHVMGLSQWVSLMLLIYIIACFLSVPAWIRLSYRFEKHRTFVIARVYFSIILLLVFWIQPGNFWLYVLANVLLGFGNGCSGTIQTAAATLIGRSTIV